MMMDWIERYATAPGSVDAVQMEVLRPLLEDFAAKTRRTLRLVDALLDVQDQRPDLAREHEQLCADHHEVLARAEAQTHDLETAWAYIGILQSRIAEIEDEASDIYSVVGLRPTVHEVVLAAARRALLSHYHPDKAPPEDKARMGVLFAAASAAFDRISEERRC